MKKRIISVLFILVSLLSGCASPQLAAVPTETLAPAPTDPPPPTEEVQPSLTPLPPTPAPTVIPLPTETPLPTEPPPSPPGIILFIGDGMGDIHRQAATWLAKGQDGVLAMDSLPIQGWGQTSNASSTTTDSAASGTAMATGQMTYNGYIGVDVQQQPLTTILEIAEMKGWATGLVTTVQLAHATPATFAAHYPERQDLPEIARQMIVQNVDVLLGGGEDDFFGADENGCFFGNGNQPKGNGLVGPAIAQGYTYVCNREEMLSVDTKAGTQLLGLFAAKEIEAPFSPTLAEMTQTALAILSQDPDGFFLMVEAGQIDWASHGLQSSEAMQFTIGLDTAVTMAMIFSLERDNTLLIVTADHETGGMHLNQDGAGSFRQDGPFHMPDDTPFWVDWTTTSHTDANVKVTAQGPHAEMLAGEYPLTRIFEAMAVMLEQGQ